MPMLRLALAGLALMLGLAIAPAANAASTTQILRDCADDGVLQGDYTPAELRKARQNIPADTDQYTDCRDVIARAAARGVAGDAASTGGGAGGGGGGGGGSDEGGPPLIPENDDDQKALDEAYTRGHDPVELGGQTLTPGAAGLHAAAARNELPGTLIAALALLAAATLALLAPRLFRSDLLSRATAAGSTLRARVGRGNG
jgi:hypothetical protein